MLEIESWGISTLTWAKQPYHIAIKRANEIGFRRIDLGLLQGWTEFGVIDLCENEAEITNNLCRLIGDNMMDVLSINTRLLPRNNDFSLTRQAYALCRLATALDSNSGVTMGTGPIDESFKSICKHVEPVYSVFNDMSIVLMVETHKDDYTEKPSNCKQLVDEFPQLRLTLDASHFIIQGYDPGDWTDLIEHTAHCHIRSCGENGWDAIQVPADRCCAKVFKSLECLQKAGYDGTYAFEMGEGLGVADAALETLRLRDLITTMR